MCATCGCSDDAAHRVHDGAAEPHQHDHAGHAHSHAHAHAHAHAHGHDHVHPHGDEAAESPRTRTLRLEQDVLAKNNLLAERNRGWFAGRGVLALNLMSSPGAGKTTLLERTIRELGSEMPIAVIEGDQATQRDAERIRAAGSRVVQITTGTGCHLDAEMIARGLRALAPPAGALLMIENVGNLVCPALFDLGEHAKVVITSVTEGEDKPLKYPHMFRAADLMLLNKVDLLPHVNFDVDRCVTYARQVNPQLRIVQTSATRGDGLATWYDWLRASLRGRSAAR
jgi:hydrogenase nickel incorporation protein HypB